MTTGPGKQENPDRPGCICPQRTDSYGARAMGTAITHGGRVLTGPDLDCAVHGVPRDPMRHKGIDVSDAYEARDSKRHGTPVIQGGV